MRARLALLVSLVVACSPTLPPPDLRPAPKQSMETDQAHLLLFPQSDAASLLGRAVHVTGDGGWTIADARAPGCEVAVREEAARYHTARQVDMHSMTSLAGGYAKFVSIEATFGKANTADIDITNTKILHADMRGACGDLVVDTVFVGHGKRTITASAQTSAKADVNVGVVSASPATDNGSKLVDAIDWQNDQAYGFTYSKVTKDEPLEIGVELPSQVGEGDRVEVHFTSKRPAYLVVYYLSGGKADVLWPSNEEPEPMVAPDKPAVLPSERETAAGFHIQAALAKPGEPSRETLVVYGFAEKADFDQMKPAAGGSDDDGPAYAAALTEKLQQIPLSRWSRVQVSYVIQPKGK